MKEEQNQFLRLLGQIAARLLKPLGNPQPNSVKYLASVEVLELAKDRAWLAKMTNAVNQHWQRKTAVRKHEALCLSDNPHSQ